MNVLAWVAFVLVFAGVPFLAAAILAAAADSRAVRVIVAAAGAATLGASVLLGWSR